MIHSYTYQITRYPILNLSPALAPAPNRSRRGASAGGG